MFSFGFPCQKGDDTVLCFEGVSPILPSRQASRIETLLLMFAVPIRISKCKSAERPRELFATQKRIANQEQNAKNPNQRTNLFPLAGTEFDERERKHAQAEPCGDTERKRSSHQC